MEGSLGSLILTKGIRCHDDRYPRATEIQIAAAEKAIGVKFPSLYKSFLAEIGPSNFLAAGGFKPEEAVPGMDVDGRMPLDLLYGISSSPNLDLVASNTGLPHDFPKGYFAIGHDPGSNLVLMNRLGHVAYFDNDSGHAYRVSDSFERFLESFGT